MLFLASHLDREQQRVIEYLQVENQVLREKPRKNRILLNDDQRRRLAVKAKTSGGGGFEPATLVRVFGTV